MGDSYVFYLLSVCFIVYFLTYMYVHVTEITQTAKSKSKETLRPMHHMQHLDAHMDVRLR